MSTARVLPARRMSMFSSSENGKPSVRAKSFPVPSGRIPMRGLFRARATPFTTSFNVPSPPAATIYRRPARTACRLHFSASPLFFVIDTALGRNCFSSVKVLCASSTDPAVGLKMMYGFTRNYCRGRSYRPTIGSKLLPLQKKENEFLPPPRNILLFVPPIFGRFAV